MKMMSVAHQQRSGGHAVISWLMCHFDRAVFSNANHWGSPFYKVSTIWNVRSDVRDADGMIRKKTKDRRREDLLEWDSPQPKDLQVVSYEGKDVNNGWRPEYPTHVFGPFESHNLVTIVRSFYNVMASKLAWKDKGAPHVGYTDDSANIWFAHAGLPWPWYRLLFDRWFRDEEYRRFVETDLLLASGHDETIELVNKIGLGSSFDRLRMNGKASEMKVLERWRLIQPWSWPKEVLANDQCRKLNLDLFGWALDEKGWLIS